MTLPKIQHPKFNIKIPSSGQQVVVRPFLVKEEKLAMFAAQSNNPLDQLRAILQILENCILESYKGFDLQKLAMFDVEYLFLKLRGISVSNMIDVSYTPAGQNAPIVLRVNIDDVDVRVKDGEAWVPYDCRKDKYHVNEGKQIALDKGVGMMVRYPNISIFDEMSKVENEDQELNILYLLTTKIYDTSQVYENFSKEEFKEFFENLTRPAMENLKKFLDGIPKLRHEINLSANSEPIVLEGIGSFFG